MSKFCEDCHHPIGNDDGPPDGWELEDGRTVCDSCCSADLQRLSALLSKSTAKIPCRAVDLSYIKVFM
jgi:hypothetical protein